MRCLNPRVRLCSFTLCLCSAWSIFFQRQLFSYLRTFAHPGLPLPPAKNAPAFCALPPARANTDTDGFTIVMNTFRRDACLDVLIPHYLSCQPFQLRLVWNDVGRALPSSLSDLRQTSNGTFVIDTPSGTNLTNRFVPTSISTHAVFSVDDDIRFPCDELHSAYRIWKSNPFRLVGFAPRLLQPTYYEWATSFQNWGWNEANTVFVTKGGFAHRCFYEAYYNDRFESFRAMVNAEKTAEDILMSFVHALSVPDESSIAPIVIWRSMRNTKDPNCFISTKQVAHEIYEPLNYDITANDRRNTLLKTFSFKLGFPFKSASFTSLFIWHREEGLHKTTEQTCGWKLGGANLAWLWCISKVWKAIKKDEYPL